MVRSGKIFPSDLIWKWYMALYVVNLAPRYSNFVYIPVVKIKSRRTMALKTPIWWNLLKKNCYCDRFFAQLVFRDCYCACSFISLLLLSRFVHIQCRLSFVKEESVNWQEWDIAVTKVLFRNLMSVEFVTAVVIVDRLCEGSWLQTRWQGIACMHFLVWLLRNNQAHNRPFRIFSLNVRDSNEGFDFNMLGADLAVMQLLVLDVYKLARLRENSNFSMVYH